MALSCKVASFTWNAADTAGTTYDVTLGFQPKFVVLWTTGVSGTTDSVGRATSLNGIGFGVGSTNRRAMQWSSADASGTANYLITHSNAAVMVGLNTSSGALDIDAEANWPSNGIRFVVDQQMSITNRRIHVLAIGGSDLAEANTFQFQEPGASGAQSVAHGLTGGAPTGAMFLSVGFGTAPAAGSNASGMLSFGVSDGTDQWVMYIGGDDGNTTMDTVSYAKLGEVIALGTEPAVTLTARASVTSFDATNVNLSWAERAATRYVFGLAWRGGQFKVSSVTTRTDTTGFNGPTNGFVAKAALFGSVNRGESTADAPTAHATWSLGGATSDTERVAVGSLDLDALGTAQVSTAQETDAVYLNIFPSHALEALMDVTSAAADPWTLVMDDADAGAAFVGVASWGANAGPSSISASAAEAVTVAESAQGDLITAPRPPFRLNNYMLVRAADGMSVGGIG